MRKLPRFMQQIMVFVPVIFVAFASGLLLNAFYQARVQYEGLLPRSRIAVFIGKDAQSSHQLIAEKILNIEGVAGAVYVPQEKVLETAVKDAPGLREVMVTGDNPFSPYFIVEPRQITLTAAQWLKDQLTSVDGVEDVRYDVNTFTVIGNLGTLVRFYGAVIKALACIGFLYAVFRFLLVWMYRMIDYRRYLILFVGGLASGALGAGLYYGLTRYLVKSTVIQIPGHYAVYMAIAGMLAVLMWEN